MFDRPVGRSPRTRSVAWFVAAVCMVGLCLAPGCGRPLKTPRLLVYTGSVVRWYPMPPVGGCRTNVAITIDGLDDVCDVKGHHNVLVLGNYGRQLTRFGRLFGIAVTT